MQAQLGNLCGKRTYSSVDARVGLLVVRHERPQVVNNLVVQVALANRPLRPTAW